MAQLGGMGFQASRIESWCTCERFARLPNWCRLSKQGDGGFCGPAHAPMQLVEKNPLARPQNMSLQGMSLDRLDDRAKLRAAFDQFRREVDNKGAMEGLDSYNAQALEILSDNGLADAIDLSKEDPKIVERYGVNDPTYQRDGAPKMVRNFVLRVVLWKLAQEWFP